MKRPKTLAELLAELAAITPKLQAMRSSVEGLLKEVEIQTPEVPEAILDQEGPPPMVYHLGILLQLLHQELKASEEILGRVGNLDEGEVSRQWYQERRRAFFAHLAATAKQLAVTHLSIEQLAFCAHNGDLRDQDIPEAAQALSLLRRSAERIATSVFAESSLTQHGGEDHGRRGRDGRAGQEALKS